MIFAHLGYKKIEISSVSFKDWQGLINTDQAFCKTLKYRKPLKNINMVNLPSWHPYWSYQVRCGYKTRIKSITNTLNKCINNPDLIKVHFGNTADLGTIRNKISDLKKSIQA